MRDASVVCNEKRIHAVTAIDVGGRNVGFFVSLFAVCRAPVSRIDLGCRRSKSTESFSRVFICHGIWLSSSFFTSIKSINGIFAVCRAFCIRYI